MILANENAISGGNYQIANSLRFQSASSQYLTRTPAGAGTSNKIITLSTWVKRGTLGSVQSMFDSLNTGNTDNFRFTAADQLEIAFQDTTAGQITTTQVFRDPSAWYHIVVAIDTTQATSSNRVKIYVNGLQVTAFATASYPAQNTVVTWTSNVACYIGRYQGSVTQLFDGYLTEYNIIDGQALTPSSFGSTDATSGQWVAAKYTGTYGTNGFYLPFSNGTSTTTLGADSSGNSNNWTLANFTRSAGVSDCWMTDVPSGNSSVGGNYAVLNPLSAISVKPINGNLTFTGASGAVNESTIGIPTSGKYYAEVTFVTVPVSGNDQAFGLNPIGSTGTGPARAYSSNGQYYNGSAWVSFGGAWAQNDVFGIAVDADNNQLSIYKNNVQQGTTQSYTVAGSSIIFRQNPSTSGTYQANFGQRSFSYTPPSGFKALCTANLPVATIKQGNKYMDATLWTGTASARSITNTAGFKPDLVWAKCRSTGYDNVLDDSVRGVGLTLISNSTGAEVNEGTNGLSAFNSNGFSIGGSSGGWNFNGASYVGWQWQAGQGSSSSNTNGSITSTVSVNATAGFSVVTFTKTGTATTKTIGHGLGVAPSMIIAKARTAVDNWPVYHISNGATFYQELNTTIAKTSGNPWGNTTPTSSVFSIQDNGTANWVAYAFAEIAGYSKFGSYTGNGSADGPFVYTGFRPKFVMIKCSSTGGVSSDWHILDTSRDTYNVELNILYANRADAESQFSCIDGLSNGFKIRQSGIGLNGSSATYIYMAFAESPFQNSNSR